MRPRFRRTFWLVVGAGASPGLLLMLSAQTPPTLDAPKITATTAGNQPPPMPKSPVDHFRALLAMSTAERENDLAGRPPEIRRRILQKLAEYESMHPEERELRLRMTQLRWYLPPLMRTAPTNRTAQLAAVPEPIRELVRDRLDKWDLLPPDLRHELSEFESTRTYFAGGESNPTTNEVINIFPPPMRDELVQKLNKVSQLPAEQRQVMFARVEKFFELTEDEKQKIAGTLSEDERREMENAVRKFERLPRAERAACLQSLRKFAGMTEVQRVSFLRNASRWKEMSAAERAAWRNLVNNIPPLPPGLELSTPPPMPQDQAGVPFATNGPRN